MPFLPYIPFANCAEVVMQWLLGEQTVLITNAVRKASPFSGTDYEDILDIFHTFWQDGLAPLTTNELGAVLMRLTDLTTVDGAVVERALGTPAAGGVDLVPVPNNAAMVVSLKTANRGRSFRGRNYVPSLPAAALATTTSWTTGTIDAMRAAYEALGDDLSTAGFDHVVLSRQNDGERRTVGVATRITTYIARSPIGTQRRRIIGRGI